MAFGSLQAFAPKLRGTVAIALLAAGLSACQSRDPSTTGSIGFGAPGGGSRSDSEALGRRYEANPRDPEAALAYASNLRALGQTAQALAVLQQAALRNPNHPGLLAAYGRVLADAGRYKEAAAVLANAHRPDRPDWRILSVQGAVADQLGQFDSAQRYYAAALKIVPGEPSVLANQGLSFALVKRLDDAERILREAANHPRADARVRRNLALVLGLRGRYQEAEAILARDMPADQARQSMAEIRGSQAAPAPRGPARQPDPWKAIRQSDAGAEIGTAPPPPAAKLDARKPVPRHAAL